MKKNRLKLRYKGCYSLPLSFPSVNHVLLANSPIECLESVVVWILDRTPKIPGWKKSAHLKKPEHVVALNNPNILRCLFLKILKCLGDRHQSKILHSYAFFFLLKGGDKYASTIPPLSLKIYELEFVTKKHKDLKIIQLKY